MLEPQSGYILSTYNIYTLTHITLLAIKLHFISEK